MGSLRNVYLNAILENYGFPDGWLANWPPDFAKRLGEVGAVSDGSFSKSGTLEDYGIIASIDPDPGRPAGPWDYQSSDTTSVEIGLDATAPGWEWIGNAKAGLKVGFNKGDSLVLSITGSHQESFLQIEGLKAALLEAGKEGRMSVGQAAIVEQEIADNGLLVTSTGSSGDLEATTNFDVSPTGQQTLASFAADLKVHRESGGAAHQSFPNGFTVAYRVIQLGRRGWFWWRHIEVEGVTRMTEDDTEQLLSREDYFAVYPDASFS